MVVALFDPQFVRIRFGKCDKFIFTFRQVKRLWYVFNVGSCQANFVGNVSRARKVVNLKVKLYLQVKLINI